MLRQLGQYVPQELTCVEAIAERLDTDPDRGALLEIVRGSQQVFFEWRCGVGPRVGPSRQDLLSSTSDRWEGGADRIHPPPPDAYELTR